jgi:hypothetical protein
MAIRTTHSLAAHFKFKKPEGVPITTRSKNFVKIFEFESRDPVPVKMVKKQAAPTKTFHAAVLALALHIEHAVLLYTK